MLIRVYLGLVAAAFFAFGAWSLLDPLGMTSSLGVDVSGPNGAYEMRGVYGGVSLGAGFLALSGARSQAMRRPALWFLLAYMGGYVFARAVAMLLGPPPTPDFAVFIAFEVAVLVGAALGLRARD